MTNELKKIKSEKEEIEIENNRQKRELRSLRDENKNIKEVNHALNT